jgi:hypothetical protein
MEAERKVPLLVRLRRKYRGGYDAVAMIVYVTVVYGWALGLGPLGRDYALLAEPERLPRLLRVFWQGEMQLFGGHANPYLLVNVILLYVCMVLVYRLANAAVRGPWWLGTLAAVLFMANPVHSESVLNLSGSTDLLPAALGLGALAAYSGLSAGNAASKWVLALGLFALAVLSSPANAGLIFVLLLWEGLIVESSQRSWRRLLPFAAVALAAMAHFLLPLSAADHRLAHVLSPLYFVFYPLGFLPESAQRFHAQPWTGWLAGLSTVVVVILIAWKARRATFLFGLLAMVAMRFYPGDRAVDPVHLIGGGQLLLPTAFFYIALAALFLRMMDHPRWRLPIVSGTTFLALIMFITMIRSVLAWQTAWDEVRAFQAKAAAATETVGVLPDYRYYRTAPVCLSESIQYDTPFSRSVPHESLLALHKLPAAQGGIAVTSRTERSATLAMDCRALLEAAPWPYDLLRAAEARGRACELVVEAKGNGLSSRTLPLELPAVR